MKFFLKYLIILCIVIWLLVLISCKHIPCQVEEDDFVHSCPEVGHGLCYICYD
jgi:uncharacterized membrane protein